MAAKKKTTAIVRPSKSQPTSESRLPLPPGYAELLEDLKNRIWRTQVRATVAASRELVRLYWDIGREIVQRQDREGWGAKVIDRLAADLQNAFPGMAGFSRTNIHRMRAFYLAYAKGLTIVAQAVRQFVPAIVPQPVRQLPEHPADLIPVDDGAILPQAVSEIPWGHNIVLLQQLKNPDQRLWYAKKTVQHGWSRAVLVHQIELDLYSRDGKAITNFSETLPPVQSDLAQQILKDPYVFDFLTLTDEARERELQRGLLERLRDLSAIDDRLRHADDLPSIGIILCKSRNRVTVEYALRDTRKPIGVSKYRLTSALPKELKSSLPTIKQLENELKAASPKS